MVIANQRKPGVTVNSAHCRKTEQPWVKKSKMKIDKHGKYKRRNYKTSKQRTIRYADRRATQESKTAVGKQERAREDARRQLHKNQKRMHTYAKQGGDENRVNHKEAEFA